MQPTLYSTRSRGATKTRRAVDARQILETELRELAAWYEWSRQTGHQEAAEALQDAADALRIRALSLEAARGLIDVWQPFVGIEARVGNRPAMVDPEADALKAAVADLRRQLREAPKPDKPRIAKLLREQIIILERQEGKSWQAAS